MPAMVRRQYPEVTLTHGHEHTPSGGAAPQAELDGRVRQPDPRSVAAAAADAGANGRESQATIGSAWRYTGKALVTAMISVSRTFTAQARANPPRSSKPYSSS